MRDISSHANTAVESSGFRSTCSGPPAVGARTRIQHDLEVSILREKIAKGRRPIALEYGAGFSNTTRAKTWKRGRLKLECGHLDQVLEIDLQKNRVLVEPRVSMEKLIRTLLPFGVTVPVVPEFKGITVGGALMGAAAESASHRWGIFHDQCVSLEIVCGNGELRYVSPADGAELFYGCSGSYGSLGMITGAELQLVPASRCVRLRYKRLTALEALEQLQSRSDFLEAIFFSKDHAVIIEGDLSDEEGKLSRPRFYYQHVKEAGDRQEEIMALEEYYFRYDQGAFWTGPYLCNSGLLLTFLLDGILGSLVREKQTLWPFSQKQLDRFREESRRRFWPPRRFMESQSLWRLLHKAEDWIAARFMLQDFCIPAENAARFFEGISAEPAIFPLWICPIQGTGTPQIFAPHLLKAEHASKYFVNFGIYGLPNRSRPLREMTRELEVLAQSCLGRKVLYSHSYYTEEEFWSIYSEREYRKLREETGAEGVWRDIAGKVLELKSRAAP